MCVLSALTKSIITRVPATALQLDIFNWGKRHIDANNHILQTVSHYELNLALTHTKWRIYLEMGEFGKGGGGSENMQQIYRRTPMLKCEFNKLHFCVGVLLYIKSAACIFLEHIFIRTHLDGSSWYRLFSTLSSCIWKGANVVVSMSWKLNEAKNFHKYFHDLLERGVGVEIKRHITQFFKNEVEKSLASPNIGCFSSPWLHLGARISAPKKLKNNFFLNISYIL